LSDETQVVDAQEAEATTAQEATTPADALEADAQTPNDLEAARKLRREANALRKRVEELEREKLSETERLQRDFEATTTERDTLRETLRAMRAEAATRDAGAIYPDLVAARIPAEALDDPEALTAAMKDLKATYPNMFRNANGSADGGAGQGGMATEISASDALRAMKGQLR
jgi:DNA-binding Lrp family transcriptional regulator